MNLLTRGYQNMQLPKFLCCLIVFPFHYNLSYCNLSSFMEKKIAMINN